MKKFIYKKFGFLGPMDAVSAVTDSISSNITDIANKSISEGKYYEPEIENIYAKEKPKVKKFGSNNTENPSEQVVETLGKGAKEVGNLAGGATGTVLGAGTGAVAGGIAGKMAGKALNFKHGGKLGIAAGLLGGGLLGGSKGSSLFSERKYGIAAAGKKIIKDLPGLGKDVGKLMMKNKKELAISAGGGLALGTTGYITDRIIQKDLKKNGQELPDISDKKFSTAGNILKTIGKGAKKSGKVIWENKKELAFPAALGALPAVGYLTDKKIQSDMTRESQEKNYSVMSEIGKKIVQNKKSLSKGWNAFKKHPGESILGGMSKISFGGGRSGVKSVGRDLGNIGKQSGNELTQKLGKAIINNPKTALGASIPVGLGVMGATWGAGEKMVNKTARTLDKDAYKYQDLQDQEIK